MSLQEGQPSDQPSDQPSVQPSDQALVSPPNGPPPKEQVEEKKPQAMNPCCCNCRLDRSVALIAVMEIMWALGSFFLCLIIIGVCEYSISQLNSLTVRTYESNWDEYTSWRRFWEKGGKIMLITLASLHGCEAIASMFLVAASSRRIRSLCFIWIVTITLLSLGIIGVIIYKQHFYSWAALVIVPFRIYFIVVVGALAAEIAIYPKGPPPDKNNMYQRGAYGGSPGYYGGYGPYYGGYGYGGYPYRGYYGGYGYGGGCY